MQGWRFLQRLRRGDVRRDHELLDQPVAVEALARHDPVDAALVVEKDPPLRQIEIESAAACRAFISAS